jgi:hypothetical protein
VRRETSDVVAARQDPQLQPTIEEALYISSCRLEDVPQARLSRAIQRHWGAIENGSHHRRDVTFHEDASRIRHPGAVQVMATLRNLALGLYELKVPRHELQDTDLDGVGVAKAGFASWQRKLKRGEAIRFFRE